MTLEDLKALRQQVDVAIDMFESGLMRQSSDSERAYYEQERQGYEARIGDFLIKKVSYDPGL